MSFLPKLDARLEGIASLVRPGARTADVGTDHGHLITWLTATGKIPGGCACDIHPKPLQKAAFSLCACHVEDKVRLVRCDGLQGLDPAECDDIVIAGMGGDTIWNIVSGVPWTRDPRLRFLLQPMTQIPRLRQLLYQNGFALEQERAVVSGGFPYTILAAHYTGEPVQISGEFAWGGLLLDDPSEEARMYLRRVCDLLTQKVRGMDAAKGPIPEKADYEGILRSIEMKLQDKGA